MARFRHFVANAPRRLGTAVAPEKKELTLIAALEPVKHCRTGRCRPLERGCAAPVEMTGRGAERRAFSCRRILSYFERTHDRRLTAFGSWG